MLRTVIRAGGPITAADVTRQTELAGATVARLLATLADEGMVLRDDGGWRPGPGVADLAGDEGGIAAMVARAAEVLRALANETGESVLLSRVSMPDMVEALVQEDADRLLGATRWVGRVFEPRDSVAGLIVAAGLEPENVAALGGEESAERERWLAQVAATRKRGYALDIDGLEAGLTSVAVAVPANPTGMVLGMAGPSSRLTPERVAEVVPLMRGAALALGPITE